MSSKKSETASFRINEDCKAKFAELCEELESSGAALFEEFVWSLYDEFKAGRISKETRRLSITQTIYPAAENDPAMALRELKNQDEVAERLEHLENMVGKLLEKKTIEQPSEHEKTIAIQEKAPDWDKREDQSDLGSAS